ncbi:MAG: hypothetical protein ACJAUV_002083 [Flavobacteriales bacterium]|jgi:hypothetical protein
MKAQQSYIINQKLKFWSLILTLVILGSCSPARRLSDGEALIWKNKVKLHQDEKYFSSTDMLEYVKPEPNQKLFGFIRLKLGLHNIGNNGKDNKIRKWFMRIGEPPSLIDSLRTERSSEQIKFYLNKQGFFNALVTDSVYYKGKKKGVAYFDVHPYQPYTLNKVSYEIQNKLIASSLKSHLEKSLLKVGQRYNYDLIDSERERLTNILHNESFYAFNKDFWYVEVDSSLGDNSVNLILKLKTTTTSVQNKSTFKPHKIGTVKIHCGFDPYAKLLQKTDTIQYKGYTVIYYEKAYLKAEILFLATFLKQGDYYKEQNLELTYKRLGALKYFGAINITFESNQTEGYFPILATDIYLTPRTKQNFNLESRVTNTGGNLGVAGSLVYGHKNAFKGGEVLEVSLAGGLESQQIITEQELDNTNKSGLFNNLELNTIEFGPEVRLIVPKFLIPFTAPNFSKSSNPKTIFSTSLNFQQRPDYIRSITNFNVSYEWNESQTKKHIIVPAEISVIKINPSTEFTNRLIALNDQLLINSYRDHLISSFRYSFIYNSQLNTKSRRNTFFRANLESAGNLLHLTNAFGIAEQKEGYQNLFNIRYAQFIKADIDVRKYFTLFNKNILAIRTKVGIGVPQQNLKVLPFERSFFGGGANDNRAWQARTIGPGAYSDTSSVISFDKIGDVKLATSIEYRFDVIKYLEGAIFVDAGNVWLIDGDKIRTGGTFNSSTFLSEIGIGAGIGARFDFDFFIIRLDVATKLKDPSLSQGERWFYQAKEQFKKLYNEDKYPQRLIWNLGIGYPF